MRVRINSRELPGPQGPTGPACEGKPSVPFYSSLVNWQWQNLWMLSQFYCFEQASRSFLIQPWNSNEGKRPLYCMKCMQYAPILVWIPQYLESGLVVHCRHSFEFSEASVLFRQTHYAHVRTHSHTQKLREIIEAFQISRHGDGSPICFKPSPKGRVLTCIMHVE